MKQKLEDRTCVVCGKVYTPYRKDQKSCRDPACVKALRHLNSRKRRKGHNEQNKLYMRKLRDKYAPKPDTIVAIGYADRQIAKSLEMAGKVKVEL